MPSRTPRSEVPRTRFSHFSFVVLPCPTEQMVQTLDGRSLVLTSIIAGSRAAFKVHGIPPLSARTHLRHVRPFTFGKAFALTHASSSLSNFGLGGGAGFSAAAAAPMLLPG